MYLVFTRYNITSIGFVLILYEAKAAHEFDLGDGSRTVLEMVLDVFLGDCYGEAYVSTGPVEESPILKAERCDDQSNLQSIRER